MWSAMSSCSRTTGERVVDNPQKMADVLSLVGRNAEVGGKMCTGTTVDLCPAMRTACATKSPDLGSVCAELMPLCSSGVKVSLSADMCVAGSMSVCKLRGALCSKGGGGSGSSVLPSENCEMLEQMCRGPLF